MRQKLPLAVAWSPMVDEDTGKELRRWKDQRPRELAVEECTWKNDTHLSTYTTEERRRSVKSGLTFLSESTEILSSWKCVAAAEARSRHELKVDEQCAPTHL